MGEATVRAGVIAGREVDQDQGGQDQDQDQRDQGRGLAQPNPSQALPPDLDQVPGQGLRLLALEHALVQLLPEQDQDQQDPELDQAPDQDLVHLLDLGQDLQSQDPHHLQDPSNKTRYKRVIKSSSIVLLSS